MNIVHGLLHALGIARWMTWQVTRSLILGFTLSAIIEALVRIDHCPPAAERPAEDPGNGYLSSPVLPLARWVSISPGATNSSSAGASSLIAPFQAASERAHAPGPCSGP